MRRAGLALVGALVCCGVSAPARAQGAFEATQPTAKLAPAGPTPLSPEAREFLAPPSFAYWAGTERITTGELSLATPRPWVDGALLPALDDHLSTTAYVRYQRSRVAGRGGATDWSLVELSTLQDIKGGPVLGLTFRADVREATALGAIAMLVYPVSNFVVVPTLAVSAGSDTAPTEEAALEVRSNPHATHDYSIGVDVSGWTDDRVRVLGKLGAVRRLSPWFALETNLAVGAWQGASVGGDAALQVVVAALHTLTRRIALYERVTVARGPAYRPNPALPNTSAYSVDAAVGVRWSAGKSYGFTLEANGGGQESYTRAGLELTAYSTLF